MNFLDQPFELIIQQLVPLSVEEIYKFCQVNQQLSQICRDHTLWRMKLQNEFPGADFRSKDPESLYLKLLRRSARRQLIKELEDVPWLLSETYEENLEGLREAMGEERYTELYNQLSVPISGLHHLVIYYPVKDRLFREEYNIEYPIRPLGLLYWISEYYQQPFTQELENYLAYASRRKESFVLPGVKLYQTLGSRPGFAGLQPYRNIAFELKVH